MRLTDLEPRWLTEGGRKVGFVFKCPTNPARWQTCFFEAGRRLFACDACAETEEGYCLHSQMGLVRAADPSLSDRDMSHVQGCNRDCAWVAHGELDFATLTITPSLDGSAAGNWHGFITNGEICGGL